MFVGGTSLSPDAILFVVGLSFASDHLAGVVAPEDTGVTTEPDTESIEFRNEIRFLPKECHEFVTRSIVNENAKILGALQARGTDLARHVGV